MLRQGENMSTETPSIVRGRPRSEASRGAIIAAATQLLRSVGLHRMTVEAVAELSGVGKATIYRWWSSKGTLALDAYLQDMRSKVIVPDTGNGFEDLRRHAQAVIGFYTGPEGRIFAEFMAEAQNDSALAEEFRTRFLKHRRAAVNSIFQRGVTRGEFRDDIDSDVAMDLIFAPIVYRLLAGHAPLSKALATQLVDAAVHGLSKPAGLARRRKPS
jgi:AcrR family transcriptional regulator